MNKAPHMLELGFHYLKAAKLLENHRFMRNVSGVNAAIGVEILLKSLIATPVKNQLIGTVAENYELTRNQYTHSLKRLISEIDNELICRLRIDVIFSDEDLDKYDSAFVKSRYLFEQGSVSFGTSRLRHCGERLFKKIMDAYKAEGCSDPFVLSYSDSDWEVD